MRYFITSCILFANILNAASQLRLSGTSIGPVYVEAGSNGQAQTINAFNLGDGTLNLSIASSASWLNATVGAPTMCSNGPVAACIPINVTLNTSGLSIGNYSETLTVTEPNAIDAPQTITVTLQVDGSPTSADFYVTPNTGTPPTTSNTAFLPVNTGGTVISSVTTTDGMPWLNFILFGGNQVYFTGYQVRASAQRGQAEGTYTGTVLLSGSTYSPDNKSISVSLHITSQPIIQAVPITLNVVKGGPVQTVNANFSNLGLGTLNISGATVSPGSGLSASVSGSSSVSVTADPGSLNPGVYFANLVLASNAANTSTPISVRVNVLANPGGPQISYGGVVDNAAFSSGQAVAAGTIAALFGVALSSNVPAYASGFPLPTSLGGVQVLINGSPAPLFYADAGQVDFQVPFSLPSGQVLIQVLRDGQPGNRISTTIDSIAPRLFILRQAGNAPDGVPYGAVLNPDNTYAVPSAPASSNHPATRGSIVTIYVLGLGPVAPTVNTGDPAPSSEPLARTTSQVQISYGAGGPGAVNTTAIYAGLAPGYAGLYQINALVPSNAPTGNVPVSVSLPGHNSNVVEMTISTQ